MTRSNCRGSLVTTVIVVLAAIGPADALAGPMRLKGSTALSGPPVQGESCLPITDVQRHTEFEPHMAADPADLDRMVVAWQQGRLDSAAYAMYTRATNDGGKTWSAPRALPGVAGCERLEDADTSGPRMVYRRVTDPWTAVDASGDFLISTASMIRHPEKWVVPKEARVPGLLVPWSWSGVRGLVSRSDGFPPMWASPATALDDHENLLHRNVIAADPADASRLYAVYVRDMQGRDVYTSKRTHFGALYFVESSDGGRTWTEMRNIYEPTLPFSYAMVRDLHVTADGSLVVTFYERNASRNAYPARTEFPGAIRAVRRSSASGEWEMADLIALTTDIRARPPERAPFPDPWSQRENSRYEIELGAKPATALSPDGTLHTTWYDIESETDRIRRCGPVPMTVCEVGTKLWMSRSSDMGATWTPPEVIRSFDWQAHSADIATARDGTLGVLFYDHRCDEPNEQLEEWTVQPRLLHSHDGGRTWADDPVAEPFDLWNAGIDRPHRMGDYYGFVGLRRSFAAALGQRNIGSASDPHDIHFFDIAGGNGPPIRC